MNSDTRIRRAQIGLLGALFLLFVGVLIADDFPIGVIPGRIGHTTVGGNIVVDGDTRLGDAAADAVNLKGTVNLYNAAGTFASTLRSDATLSRTITFPDANGTVAVSASAPVTLSVSGNLGLIQNAGTDVTANLEEESQIRGTAVTDDAANAEILVGDGVATAKWVLLSNDASLANTGEFTIAADAVALTTDTTGNYVASVGTSALTGLTGGAAGSEGATLSLAWDYTATLGADPALAAGVTVAGTTGFIFEGATANGFESLLTITDPTVDRTITLPNDSGTVALLDGSAVQVFTSSVSLNGTTTNLGGLETNALVTLGHFESPFLLSDDPAIPANGWMASGGSGGGLIFEGTSANAFETRLTLSDPTVDRTITLPNLSGTVALEANPASFTALTSTTSLTSFGTLSVTGASTLSGLVTLGLPAVDTPNRLSLFRNGTRTIGIGAEVTPTLDLGVGPLVTSGSISTSGGVASINVSSNFATNINTGTSTGALSLGGGSGTVAVDSTSWDISTAGVGIGFTGITTTTLSATTSATIGSGSAILKHTSTVTAAIDLAATGVSGTSTATAAVVGASLGDTVTVVPAADDAAWDHGNLTAFVESIGTVKIVYSADATGGDPASMTYRIDLWQH